MFLIRKLIFGCIRTLLLITILAGTLYLGFVGNEGLHVKPFITNWIKKSLDDKKNETITLLTHTIKGSLE